MRRPNESPIFWYDSFLSKRLWPYNSRYPNQSVTFPIQLAGTGKVNYIQLKRLVSILIRLNVTLASLPFEWFSGRCMQLSDFLSRNYWVITNMFASCRLDEYDQIMNMTLDNFVFTFHLFAHFNEFQQT